MGKCGSEGGFMYEILKNIDTEKRDRIVNAAIKEFSLYPYTKASTNNIVKEAGISKGLLFHYFGSKKELYEKLIGFVLHKLVEDISSNINWEESDILERIKQLVIFKMKLGKEYPGMFDFLVKVLAELSTKNTDDIMKFYQKYDVDIQSILDDVYTRNIDYSKFSDQTNLDKSLNVVRWTLEKYSEEQLLTITSMKVIDYDKVKADIDEYISVLKRAFYR